MAKINAQDINAPELLWVARVRERLHPLNEQSPIWVRHGIVDSGPTCPHPERHPYYEFGTNFAGVVTQFVKKEKTDRLAGDLFLAGPGLPHYSVGKKYPHHFATVFFLPSVLIGMGPISDGARILRRFTMRQSLASHLVRPPPRLRELFLDGFREMITEFDGNRVGREMKLRSILITLVVEMLRWEEQSGRATLNGESFNDWRPLDRALVYLHEHFRDSVYAYDLARHAGVSESRLKVLFHDALGIPWSRYLQSYRIHRSLDYLGIPGRNISEAAFAVGFESLSHFNASFRSLMGMAPRQYAHRASTPDGGPNSRFRG
jgi:AraC-like DNA-binding protein